MHMKAFLPHIEDSSYYFDMTPSNLHRIWKFPSSDYFCLVFQITPRFSLQSVSWNTIRMNVEPINPPAFCEKSVMRSLSSSANQVNKRLFYMNKPYVFRIICIQTWTVLEPNKSPFYISNLLPKTIYRICVKCKQTYSDPEGSEQCQNISTNSRFRKILHKILHLRERHSFFHSRLVC